jgi:RNA polymerase sigma-70 factor (ECF subfamily)
LPAIPRSTRFGGFVRALLRICATVEPAAEEIDPLAGRERSEKLAALVSCLQALDEEKREAVLLAYYRGSSREALAARFGRPVPTLKTWLHRSLAQLRDCLAS